MRSTAKPAIVKDYQRRGFKVVFVGDGLSDVEAVEVADVVYAKDVLLREARERGIVVREFDELNDVYRDLRHLFTR
jgi:2-hydroxy-3-keto-5-methylthiopentenyl-1-phosphate phosphatase